VSAADRPGAPDAGPPIGGWLWGLRAIVYKEWIQLRRDPATRLVFVIPLVQTLLFGFAIDTDLQHIPTVVFDQDRSETSRKLIEDFEGTQTFRVTREVASPQAVRAAIVAGEAKIGVVVPPDLQARRLRGEPATVQVLIDGSDGNVARDALQTAQLVGFQASLRAAGQDPAALLVQVRPRVFFNPDLLSSHFYVPGLVGIILQIVTVFLTAFAVVRERERGTLEQLMVTPVSRGALVLGKILPYAVIGFLQSGLTLSVMRWVFGVPIAGSVSLLLLLSVSFLVPSLAIGLLISTIAENQAQATQFGLLVMIPSILLSGFVFPRETMPAPIYALTFAIPVTYYIQILRGIVLRGAGIAVLWPQVLALCGFGVGLVTLSVVRFQKRVR